MRTVQEKMRLTSYYGLFSTHKSSAKQSRLRTCHHSIERGMSVIKEDDTTNERMVGKASDTGARLWSARLLCTRRPCSHTVAQCQPTTQRQELRVGQLLFTTVADKNKIKSKATSTKQRKKLLRKQILVFRTLPPKGMRRRTTITAKSLPKPFRLIMKTSSLTNEGIAHTDKHCV